MAVFETVVQKVRKEERGGRTWYTGEVEPASVDIDGERKTVREVQTLVHGLGELMVRLRDSGERVQLRANFRAKPRQNGGFWENWYLEGVEKKVEEPPVFDEPEPEEKRGWGGKSAQERWEIALSVGSKLAVDTLPFMSEDQRDPESQWRLALFWATRIHATPLPNLQQPLLPPVDEKQEKHGPGAYEEPEQAPLPSYQPAGADEDIPF